MASSTSNTSPPTGQHKGYQFGYSKATTSSHASRTIHTDGAFAIPHIKPHFKILDVGCGPGTITIGFASLIDPSQGGSVTGVDTGLPVLESARALADSQGYLADGRMKFQQVDILEGGLPFADGSFDMVFTSQTLSHLTPAPEAPVSALKEMRRVLKPNGGGVLAARDASSLTYHPYRAELQRCMVDRIFQVIGTGEPTGPHMPEYLRLAGFEVDNEEKVKVGGGSTIYTGKEKVKWWRDTMGGRLAEGDASREGWLKAGITEEEIDEARRLMDLWAEAEGAWYGTLQSEVLAWK